MHVFLVPLIQVEIVTATKSSQPPPPPAPPPAAAAAAVSSSGVALGKACVQKLVSVERWSCSRGASCVVEYSMGTRRLRLCMGYYCTVSHSHSHREEAEVEMGPEWPRFNRFQSKAASAPSWSGCTGTPERPTASRDAETAQKVTGA